MRILALIVLVVGFLIVWGGVTPVDPDLEEICPPFGETQGYSIEIDWWPPGGTRCEVSDGTTKVTYPWREYLTVVLIALSVALFRPRPVRALASFGLLVAGLAVFFGVV